MENVKYPSGLFHLGMTGAVQMQQVFYSPQNVALIPMETKDGA